MGSLKRILVASVLVGVLSVFLTLVSSSGLEVIVTPCCRAVVLFNAGPESQITGFLELVEQQDGDVRRVSVNGTVKGLPPNSTHGFHIHENGDFRDTTNPCLSTGRHYNPHRKLHGAPEDDVRHVGDLGNIVTDGDGIARINLEDTVISLSGPLSVIGRAVVIHARPDDLGRNGGATKSTGNAGGRLKCGIIGKIDLKPLEITSIYDLYKLNHVYHYSVFK